MKIYMYYNPNPRGRSVGDCTVRAVSAALGVSWDAAFRGIARQARSMADMPSADAVWGAYLKSRGFRRRTIANTCPDCYTAADFAREHPHGVYVLAFGGHREQPAKQNTEQGVMYATKTDLKDVLDVVDDLKRQLDEMRLKMQNNAPEEVL